jgi:3',5'-cyclic AMP phosphodiesterase CpdA
VLRVALITDLHFGPAAGFGGKLRKLSHRAPELTAQFATHMREVVRPDLVVNLGDDIEDDNPEQDAARYAEVQRLLSGCDSELVNVAGNHDRIHLSDASLLEAWGMPADTPLYRSFDRGGFHLVVLATHEQRDVQVTIDDEQLAWLEADLAAATLPTVVFMHHSAADQDLGGNRWFEKRPHLCLIKRRATLRRVLEQSGRCVAVFNGHLHWNHLDVIAGIPYVTLQSLIENLHEDAPGLAANAWALVTLSARQIVVEVAGEQPARYQFAVDDSRAR